MTNDDLIADPDKVRTYYQETVAREWGVRVDERMRLLNIRDADLARKVGTTPQTIWKVKRGQMVPREYLRVMIAFALAADPTELFPAPSREAILKAVAA